MDDATYPTQKGSRKGRITAAVLGALAGPLDTALLRWFGVSFEINGADGSWLIAAYFGVTFALLGYLIASLAESRKRDREQAELLQRQREEIHQTRVRLAQSEKLAAMGQLATMIAHEVRNPLGVMRSSAQEIGDSVGDDDNARRATSFILKEIDRLNRVIESILGFAKPIRPKVTSVRLSEIAERAIQLAAEHPRAADCRILLDKGEDPVARVDPDLITQVVLDSIANALEASPASGVVRVEIEDGTDLVVAISDQGPGVADTDRERIFEPFYSTHQDGTGLGLAVSRQIVAGHGGTLAVAEDTTGARFEIRLPRHHEEIAA